VFYGDSIEEAVAADGRRYAAIETAFLYRERLVPDCTCTGKDAAGLASIDAKQDPTLERGDVIATLSGFVAYAGPARGTAQRSALHAGRTLRRVLSRHPRQTRGHAGCGDGLSERRSPPVPLWRLRPPVRSII
jgi:hypothetical protein